MTSGITVLLGDERYPLSPGETVLEALERGGVSVHSSCRAGHCHSCLMRAEAPPAEAQQGLRETQRAAGYFLACRATPTEELRILSTDAMPRLPAQITETRDLGAGVLRIRLRTETPLGYHPGQFVNIEHPSGQVRSYSLASTPRDAFLELHVRRIEGGFLSGWLHQLQPGAELTLRGPFGACFYVAGRPDSPLLLAGAGTGLAPLYGIARDALESGHTGSVVLLHGGLDPSRLYYQDELAELAGCYEQLTVRRCVLRAGRTGYEEGSLEGIAGALAKKLGKPRCYLCGDAGLVQALRRTLFLGGVASADILADPFLPAAVRTAG